MSAEEFNGVEDLLNPELRGAISIRELSRPHGGSLTFTGILNRRGEDFVRTLLTEQEPTFVDNARLNTDQVIRGRFPVAIGTDNRTLDQCRLEGGCGHIEDVNSDPYLLGHGAVYCGTHRTPMPRRSL